MLRPFRAATSALIENKFLTRSLPMICQMLHQVWQCSIWPLLVQNQVWFGIFMGIIQAYPVTTMLKTIQIAPHSLTVIENMVVYS